MMDSHLPALVIAWYRESSDSIQPPKLLTDLVCMKGVEKSDTTRRQVWKAKVL